MPIEECNCEQALELKEEIEVLEKDLREMGLLSDSRLVRIRSLKKRLKVAKSFMYML